MVFPFTQLEIQLYNDGKVTAHRKGGCGSIVDLALSSFSLACEVPWDVSTGYSYTDYKAIVFDIRNKSNASAPVRSRIRSTSSYSTKVSKHLWSCSWRSILYQARFWGKLSIAFSAPHPTHQYRYVILPPVEILTTGGTVKSLTFGRLIWQTISQGGLGQRNFKVAIQRSTRDCFRQLCSDADINSRGSAYRVVIVKCKRQEIYSGHGESKASG